MLKSLKYAFKKKLKKSTLETDAIADQDRDRSISLLDSEISNESTQRVSDFALTTENNPAIPAYQSEVAVQQNTSQLQVVPENVPNINVSRHPTTALPFANNSGLSTASPAVSIVVNNSSGFHIGESINISLHDNSSVTMSPSGLGVSNIGEAISKSLPKVEENLSGLEDIIHNVNDEDVLLIAKNLDHDWKSFGKALSMTDQDLSAIEQKYSNSTVASIKMLRQFINCYPDTSIGFLAASLRESGQMKALKLLQKHCPTRS